MKFATLLGTVILAAGSGPLAHAAVIFNFDTDNVGTSTQFTDTSGGISATFSSPGDPGGFAIEPSTFQALSGNVLGDPGPAFLNNLSLNISFDSKLTAISLVFATGEFGTASPLVLDAYNGSAFVGSASATGFVPNGFFFPEGEIAFVGSAFDRVVLSTVAQDFAIDNVAVAQAPEPGSVSMLALGLILLATQIPLKKLFLRRYKTMKNALLPLLIGAAGLSLAAHSAQAQSVPPVLPLAPPSASTVPPNGDVNPYGVAFVQRTVPSDGMLQQGDVLISNFNNAQNLQGTGTTIVRVSQLGQTSLFYQSPAAGLTAALGILSNGVVIVGNLPTADGTSATVQPGSLTFIDRFGSTIGSITGNGIDGPWGMSLSDSGAGTAKLFISNVLSGTVIRYTLTYSGSRVVTASSPVTIGSAYNHRLDPAALVLGPSGLYYDSSHDLLYVASSADNAIYSIPQAGAVTSSAGTGNLLVQDFTHLHGPLDIVFAPNGHLLVANSDGSNVDPNQPSELVEFTTTGQFIAQYSIDPNNGGAFGLNTFNIGFGTIRLAAVDDNTNTVRLWTTFVP
jgi:hypothetical protein